MEDNWATKAVNEQENDNIFKTSIPITNVNALDIIPKHEIKFTNIGILNQKDIHNSIITNIEYSKNGQLMVITGLDKTLELINTQNKRVLKKLFLNDLPIMCCRFSADNKEIIITGRRPYFYIFKLSTFEIIRINKIINRNERSWEYIQVSPTNKYYCFIGGNKAIILLNKKTKKSIKTMYLSKVISKIKFNKDGSLMYVLTLDCYIYIFDMKNGYKCVDCIKLNGIIKGMCFDIYNELNLIAVGCSSGIVSVYKYYNLNNELSLDDKLKILNDKDGLNDDNLYTINGDTIVLNAVYDIGSLTTTVTGVKFNHDGQLLLIYSRLRENSIRLVNVKTGKVYINWPGKLHKKYGYNYVYNAVFSPKSGYIAVGNDCGYVKLVRLHFYGDI